MADINNKTTVSMDDIVFEDRNKTYGAYQLRKDFTKNFIGAMVITVAAVTLFLYGYSYYLANREPEPETEYMLPVVMEDIPLDEEAPKPEEIKVPPPEVEQIKFVPFEPKEIVRTQEIPPTQEELDSIANISNKNQEGPDSSIMIEPTGNKIIENDNDEGFLVTVEEPAVFPGGPKAWEKWMRKIDGKKAEKLKVPGKVIVYFEVDKHGKMINLKILKGFNKECDEEALRVITEMQQSVTWEPAKLNGRPGKVKMQIPIKFAPPPEEE
jgi:protein TonB